MSGSIQSLNSVGENCNMLATSVIKSSHSVCQRSVPRIYGMLYSKSYKGQFHVYTGRYNQRATKAE